MVWHWLLKVAKFDYMSCPAPAMRLLMLGMKVLLFTLATSHQFLGMDTLVQPLEISTLHMSSLVQKTAASCGMLWVSSAARTHKHPNIQKTHGHSWGSIGSAILTFQMAHKPRKHLCLFSTMVWSIYVAPTTRHPWQAHSLYLDWYCSRLKCTIKSIDIVWISLNNVVVDVVDLSGCSILVTLILVDVFALVDVCLISW